MTKSTSGKDHAAQYRKTSRVRLLGDVLDGETQGRREFLRMMAARGASIPATYFMIGDGLGGRPIPGARAALVQPDTQHKGTMHLKADSNSHQIARDFSDPYMELIRLLRETSEIEHALMIQYLYAAFSVKPEFESIIGYGAPDSNNLLGVAIEEMQHLGKVNKFLVALGAAPNLARQDFPYEPDIYPFELNLEPLSERSLAKYTYTEAGADSLDRSKAETKADLAFLDQLGSALGENTRPNRVGSVYATVIQTTEELSASADTWRHNLRPWINILNDIKRQGEEGHFKFFRKLFMGTHEGFNGRSNVWSLSPEHPAYPALQLPVNPSAYVGHENQIEDPRALSIAWLGNLHYWIILTLLDFAYRQESSDSMSLANTHMLGPLLSIMQYLPRLGAGMPFDPLSMGYFPGRNPESNLLFVKHMLGEADRLERELAGRLPGDFPTSVCRETIKAIAELPVQWHASKL